MHCRVVFWLIGASNPAAYVPPTARPVVSHAGGVNSPVRAFKSVGGGPIVFERVKGAYAWDVDGNKYIDYVLSWGPAIVGHANDEVNEVILKQLQKGCSFGAPCELEVGFRGLRTQLKLNQGLLFYLLVSHFLCLCLGFHLRPQPGQQQLHVRAPSQAGWEGQAAGV